MLSGFTIVQPRTGPAEGRLPARIYAVNGERLRFELLRDAGDIPEAVRAIREAIADGGEPLPRITRSFGLTPEAIAQ